MVKTTTAFANDGIAELMTTAGEKGLSTSIQLTHKTIQSIAIQ